jgi:hypothetical protein
MGFAKQGQGHRLSLTCAQQEHCIAVALLAHCTLHDERLYFPPLRGQTFQSRAAAVGYSRSRTYVDSVHLLAEYREFYGDDFINACARMHGGAGVDRLSLPGFPVRDMRAEWEVLFMSEFLQRTWNSLWPYCINPLADHGADFRVSFISRFGSEWVAACECGFHFGFSRTQINAKETLDITSYGPHRLKNPVLTDEET